MTRSLPLMMLLSLAGLAIAVPAPQVVTFAFVDLQPHGNRELKKSLGGGDDNGLTGLVPGGKGLRRRDFQSWRQIHHAWQQDVE